MPKEWLKLGHFKVEGHAKGPCDSMVFMVRYVPHEDTFITGKLRGMGVVPTNAYDLWWKAPRAIIAYIMCATPQVGALLVLVCAVLLFGCIKVVLVWFGGRCCNCLRCDGSCLIWSRCCGPGGCAGCARRWWRITRRRVGKT